MVKNRDLQGFKKDFSSFHHLTGVDFVLKLNRNLRLVIDELDLLENLRVETAEFKAFKTEGQALYIKHSAKDSNGNPKTEPIQTPQGIIRKYVTDNANKPTLEKEIKALEKKYKDAVDLQNQKEQDFASAMDAECTLKFSLIEKGDLPEKITVEQLGLLTNMNMVKF